MRLIGSWSTRPLGWMRLEARLVGREKLAHGLGAVGGKRVDTFERITEAQLLILEGAKGVIGQHLDLLDHRVTSHVLTEAVQPLVVVGEARHHHVSHPGGDAALLQLVEEPQVVVPPLASETRIEVGVHRLDVEQHEVGVAEHIEGAARAEDATGVEGRVEPLGLAEGEKLGGEVGLHQRLATRQRHAAALDEATVAQHLVEQLLRGELVLAFAMRVPRVGVMAELAAQRTALHERHEAYTGPVDGAKRFHGMNVANGMGHDI